MRYRGWASLQPDLEPIPMPLGWELYESRDHMGLVSFPPTNRAVVQSAGNGYRLKASILKREFALGGHLQHLALRYTRAPITQLSQTVACNRHHTLEQQLCRWLLLSLDRLAGNHLAITQELIANMLGIRREGMTQAAAVAIYKGMGDPLQSLSYHRTGSPEVGETGMRMLFRSEEEF